MGGKRRTAIGGFRVAMAVATCWSVAMYCAGTTLAAEPRADRCVILISVDGLANFYLDDPQADMPTLRRLIREGARAEGIVCSFPTVTWPNHTTLVTGVPPAKHGVLGNNYFDRETKKPVPLIPDPLFDKVEIVKSPTVYDVAHQAGLKTAGVIWPATRNAPTLDWTVPDMGGDEAWPTHGTRSWLAEMREAGLPVDKHGTWVRETSGGVQRDWLYTRMSRHVLEHHKPNLLLLHLVEVDHVEHRYGPRSPEAYWAVSYADDRLRDIVDAVESSPRKDQTTIIVASDHGFFPIERDICPNVLLRQAGINTADNRRVACVAQGGSCMVYILDETQREALTDDLTKRFAVVEGMQAVIPASQAHTIGQATPAADSRAPDLWLAAKSGYSFSATENGENIIVPRDSRGGTHGYLPDQPDMLGSLVMWGAGVKQGVTLKKASNMDVAPTMAKLLGVEMPSADGKVLTEALSHE